MSDLFVNSKFLPLILLYLISGGVLIYIILKKQQSFKNSSFAKLRSYKDINHANPIKYSALFLLLILLSVTLLRPQWGHSKNLVSAKGADILFTLDISKSMEARDMTLEGQKITRLEFAKYLINVFIAKNENNRHGLVIFAGDAFVSTPITSDIQAFMTFLAGTTTQDARKQGTDLSSAIKTSVERFIGDEETHGKAIILLSDGGEDIDKSYKELAELAKKNNIKIFTVGVGTKKGAPIIESRDFFGNVYYKQYKGEKIITKLEDQALKKTSSISNGKYIQAETIYDLEKFQQDIDNLEVFEYEKSGTNYKEDKYQIFLFIGFIFFMIFIFTPKGRNIALPMLLLLFLGGCSNDLSFKYHNSKGGEYFKENFLNDAKSQFKKASEKSENLAHISQNNTAISEYEERDFEQSQNNLKILAEKVCTTNIKDQCNEIYYNLGNSYYRNGEETTDLEQRKNLWQEAIKAYQNTLRLDPDDTQAQENIEFIESQLQKLEQQQKEEQNQSQENSDEGENKNNENKEGEENESESKQDTGEDSQRTKPTPLNEDLKNQIEQYMKQMRENEAKLQQYIQRAPQKESDDMTNDPFLQNFFEQTPKFNDKNDINEKDW